MVAPSSSQTRTRKRDEADCEEIVGRLRQHRERPCKKRSQRAPPAPEQNYTPSHALHARFPVANHDGTLSSKVPKSRLPIAPLPVAAWGAPRLAQQWQERSSHDHLAMVDGQKLRATAQAGKERSLGTGHEGLAADLLEDFKQGGPASHVQMRRDLVEQQDRHAARHVAAQAGMRQAPCRPAAPSVRR